MDDVLHTIQLLVAPVVMISANGLLCLALYNRLAAIVSRSRIFLKEHFEEVSHLASLAVSPEHLAEAALHKQRIAILDEQVMFIMKRARWVRLALFCLMSSVLCMLACSLMLGLMLVAPSVDWLALTFFFIGVVIMAVGIVLAMWELIHALDPLLLEQKVSHQLPGDKHVAA